MHQFNESGGRNAREVFVIQEVGGDFADGGLAGEDAGAEGLTAEGTSISAGVVGGVGLFVNGLQDRDLLLLGISHFVCSTRSLVRQLWLQSRVESRPDIVQDLFHDFGLRHGAVNVNVGIVEIVYIGFEAETDGYRKELRSGESGRKPG